MNWYDRHLLPYLIDIACGLPMVQKQRRQLVPQAHGRVLEVGMGTGRNLPFYDRSRITRLVGVDPAMQMHRLAQKRSREAGIEVELMGLSAEQLPADDASFDTVVCTYTLCSIPDAAQALREMRRVLVPGGKLLFCEHGRAPDANVRRWQDRLQPLWGPLAGGCHLGRDIPSLLDTAGFAATTQAAYLAGPRPMTFHYWGEAQAS
ncbi:SAM-dependent methyltransferase [Limnohabitans sp. MMS-10A-160]|uniref:class I SAM-dependent methyltransferase n=1 Tax=unclassified Limnohabitans TaxID=2626134 RepID=UPI000D3D45E3|nr:MULTISPECIES: class I SAM-dependent methyltransferase [unclassified Limnohabitans]PUE19134.1 SAM-dependent methyltransferase [Limnohabitans sp. MMS-10A-192]PUE24260.1 SAM-dependent methyltransferase [Limnohabitans sp. MMS-10A-160]